MAVTENELILRLPLEWQDVASKWIISLKDLGKADNTRETYVRCVVKIISELSDVLGKVLSISNMNSLTIEVANQWEADRLSAGDAATTINARFNAFKLLVKFEASRKLAPMPSFFQKKYIPVHRADPVQVPPTFVDHVAGTERQSARRYELAGWIHQRDQAVIKLLGLGAKPGEIASISRLPGDPASWNNISISRSRGKAREIELTDSARLQIKHYLQWVPFDIPIGQPLFLDNRAKPIAREAIKSALKRMSENSGLPIAVTSTAIRRGAAMKLKERGVPVEDVAASFGVSPLAITKIVTRTDQTTSIGRARAGGHHAFLKPVNNNDHISEKIIRNFMAYLLLETNLNIVTIMTYSRLSRDYLDYCAKRESNNKITICDANEFLMNNDSRYRGGTRKISHTSVACFIAWLEREGFIDPHPMIKDYPRASPLFYFDYFPRASLERLLTLLDNDYRQNIRKAMASAIFTLSGLYGMHQNEIANCKFSHIDFDNMGFAVIKVDEISISLDQVSAARIRNLIDLYGGRAVGDHPLLVSPRNAPQPITNAFMHRLISETSMELGLKPASNRTLRNGFIAHILVIQRDITKASALVRVRDIERLLRIRALIDNELRSAAANDQQIDLKFSDAS